MTPMNDDRVWQELDGSLPGRLIRWVGDAVDRASGESLVSRTAAKARSEWRAAAGRGQLIAIGSATLSAVVTHLLLQATQRPVGWWWLMVPSMVAAFGVVALVGGLRARE